nr:putative integron gene cassette protein [uncultured bacterium]
MMRDDFSPIAEPVDDTASFVLWAIRQLGLEVTRDGEVCRLIVPEGASAAALDGQRQMAFKFDRRDVHGGPPADQPREGLQLVAADTPLFGRLMAELRTVGEAAPGGVVHTRPAGRPIRVGQISARLFTG